VSQRHAVLQSTDSIRTQITGMLTGHLGKFMGGARIGIEVPDVVQLGSSISIEAISRDGDSTLPLRVHCNGEDGLAFGSPKLMRATGDGRYHANIDALPEGAWQITAQSATPSASGRTGIRLGSGVEIRGYLRPHQYLLSASVKLDRILCRFAERITAKCLQQHDWVISIL
jgi:hypothetical protein